MCIEESEDIRKTPLDNSAYLQMRDMIIQNIGHPLPTAFDEIHSDLFLSFGDMTWKSEAHDLEDIGYPEDAPVITLKSGFYELQYREGWGTKKFIIAKNKLPEHTDIFVIEKILYKGEPILSTFTWTPKYARDKKVNNPLRLCVLMHELVEGVKQEEVEKNGQLT